MKLNVILMIVFVVYGMTAIYEVFQNWSRSETPLLITSLGELTLQVPTQNIATGTIEIARTPALPLSEWFNEDQKNCYKLLQQIYQIWEHASPPLNNSLFYGVQKKDETDFHWFAIPYSSWMLRLSQISTLVFAVKPFYYADQEERQNLRQAWRQAWHTYYPVNPSETNSHNALTSEKVLKIQKIWEGDQTYLLYNYNPIPTGGEDIQFLIVSKHNKTQMKSLSEKEYLEAAAVTKAILQWTNTQENIVAVYLYENSGPDVQSQKVYHRHVIALTQGAHLWKGMFEMAKHMVYSQHLSPEETRRRADHYQQALKTYLPEPSKE